MKREEAPKWFLKLAVHQPGDRLNEQLYYLQTVFITIVTLKGVLGHIQDHSYLVDVLEEVSLSELIIVSMYLFILLTQTIQTADRLQYDYPSENQEG